MTETCALETSIGVCGDAVTKAPGLDSVESELSLVLTEVCACVAFGVEDAHWSSNEGA